MAAVAGANISNMKSNLIKPSPSLPLLLAKQSPPISSSQQQLNAGQWGHRSYQMGDAGTRKVKENPRYEIKGNFGVLIISSFPLIRWSRSFSKGKQNINPRVWCKV